jgi:hypothetical protein
MVSEVVECRSDSQYAERPLAFVWEGQRQKVTDVLSQWRTPDGMNFKVRTESGSVYDLRYIEARDEWTITQIS